MVRFLMDIGWYAEAKQELDRLVRDFPGADLKERAANARAYIVQAEAAERRAEIDVSRAAQQYQRESATAEVIQGQGDSDRATGRGPRDPAA